MGEFGLEYMPAGTKGSYLMRSVMDGITASIAFATQNFADVFALFSSVCGPVEGIFFVFVFARKIRRQAGAPEYGAPRKAFHAVLMLSAVFCIVFGFFDSAMNLMGEIEQTESPTSEPLSGGTSPDFSVIPGKTTVQAALVGSTFLWS